MLKLTGPPAHAPAALSFLPRAIANLAVAALLAAGPAGAASFQMDQLETGDFHLGRDIADSVTADSDDVFMVKMSYYLN